MPLEIHRTLVKHFDNLPKRFERKFYLAPNKVSLSRGLLQHVCLPDGEYPSEQINSLYFDTMDLEQHQNSSSGEFFKDKIRIRWYGAEDNLQEMQTVFIELKSRQGFASTKQRLKLQVPSEKLALDNLGKGIVPNPLLVHTLASFGYFPTDHLVPIVKISYWRYRFCDALTGQRVSLDCHIRSTIVIPGLGNGEKVLELDGGVIEIKGQTVELPPALMQLRMMDVDWGQFSKYSACINSHAEEPGTIGRFSPSGRIAWP